MLSKRFHLIYFSDTGIIKFEYRNKCETVSQQAVGIKARIVHRFESYKFKMLTFFFLVMSA
jgi:hypothetical protein